MTRAYVLDRVTRDTLGLVDQSWEKLSYTRRYWGMDTFTMTIQRARLYADSLANGNLLYLPDEGDRLFLIEQIQSVSEGSARNDLMTVQGRSLEGIAMAERVVVPPAGQDYDKQTAVPGETAMKHYVTDHASSTATDADRRIPGLVCIASGATGANVTVSGRYQYVFDLVKQIGLLTGQGWEITYNPVLDRFEFDVINGVDRSASVFFDFAFETLEKWEELDSILDSKTLAYVAGQGEGAARDVVPRYPGIGVEPEPTGFDRREAFIDARDIDYGAFTELQARGDAYLAAASGEIRLEAGIHQYGSFRYGVHWDMGDLVLVRNEERGISYTARVVEVEKSFAASAAAPVVTAIIDRPFPTLKEQVNGAGAGAGAVDYPNNVSPDYDEIFLDKASKDIRLYRAAAGVLGQDTDGGSVDSRHILRATAGRRAYFDAAVSGDTVERATLGGDATLTGVLLGSGSAAQDIRLKRNAAGELFIDSNGQAVATDVKVQATSGRAVYFSAVGQAGQSAQVRVYQQGDNAGRVQLTEQGRLEFGPGNAAVDTNFYRTAAGILKTDGGIYVGQYGVSAGLELSGGGSIEMLSVNPYIDFKNAAGDDFDARIIYNLSGDGRLRLYGAPVELNSKIFLGAGSSFPTPVTNGHFWRTDKNMEFWYTGSRWLSAQAFELHLPNDRVGMPISASTAASAIVPTDLKGGTDLWIEDFVIAAVINNDGSALSASHKWGFTAFRLVDSTSTTSAFTVEIASGASNTGRVVSMAVDSLWSTWGGNAGSPSFLQLNITKTGTPGSFYWGGKITYRVVAT